MERAHAQEDIARKNELLELRDLLADPRMRQFLWRMMAKSGMFTDPWNPNAAIMGRNTGFGAMGRALYNEIIEAYPEAWILMQQEALGRAREAEALAAADAEDRAVLASE